MVRLLERVASRATQKQSDFSASAWDVGRVTLREEKRGSRVVKALRKKAAQKEATQPREKVDKFTKQMLDLISFLRFEEEITDRELLMEL